MGNVKSVMAEDVELMVQIARREDKTATTPEALWPVVERVLADAHAPVELVRAARKALFEKGIDLGRTAEGKG